MQGRFAIVFKVSSAILATWLIAGCGQPRVKSYESAQAATTNNPPRDWSASPVDPYSWGGIAMASGGREPRTTYGALAPGSHEGANDVYMPVGGTQPVAPDDENSKIYLVPDPRTQDKSVQYLGSTYIGNEEQPQIYGGPGVLGVEKPSVTQTH